MIYSPMVFSLVVVGLIWSWFLQPEFGLVEHILRYAGILGPDEHFNMMASFSWATAGLIIAACWPHAAYCMILFLTGLSNLNKSVIEAAMIDGVNRRQLIFHIILPMLRPATLVVTLVTIIGALRTFELVAVMTGGGPANSSNVLANYMYQQTFQSFRYGFGAAIAVVLFMISLSIIGAYLYQTRKSETA
jgi:multiple sugar transport system permease protein